VTLIDPLHPAGFFSQEHFYDYENDFERFTYFCRASLELLVKLGKQADILHLHNWQTAAVAPLFWDIFVHQGLGNTRLLFTCHDFKYQVAYILLYVCQHVRVIELLEGNLFGFCC
jgi:starch synthase